MAFSVGYRIYAATLGWLAARYGRWASQGIITAALLVSTLVALSHILRLNGIIDLFFVYWFLISKTFELPQKIEFLVLEIDYHGLQQHI